MPVPIFRNLAKKVKIVITTGGTVGWTEGIINGTRVLHEIKSAAMP